MAPWDAVEDDRGRGFLGGDRLGLEHVEVDRFLAVHRLTSQLTGISWRATALSMHEWARLRMRRSPSSFAHPYTSCNLWVTRRFGWETRPSLAVGVVDSAGTRVRTGTEVVVVLIRGRHGVKRHRASF